ncbi:MAG: TonB-dependent receptor, partial [Lysobacter sp.]
AATDADADKEAAAAVEATELPAVTVSARLGQESPKDVPFGLSVTRGSDIDSGRLLDVEEVLRNSPGVDVNSSGGANEANVRIRGVGSLNQVSMDDGSVVMNIDGVAMSVRHASLATFDVDRVEVLKGPQGTLFGRNSEAGAINVTTRRPTREREGYVRVEAGEGGQHLEEGAIGGALSEHLSGRIAVRNSGFDSWVDNVNNGRPVVKPAETALRGSLLWDTGQGTQALLIVEGQDTRNKTGLILLRPYGEHPTLDLTPGVFDGNYKNTRRYSLQIDHDLNASRITSITARTEADLVNTRGYDRRVTQALYGSPFEYMGTDLSDERVTSQDLRWQSLPQAKRFWVLGTNWSHSARNFDSVYRDTGNLQQRDFETDSYAVYGEGTIPLNDAFKLTGGLRYSNDRKTYDGVYFTGGPGVADRRRIDEDYLTGRVALSYVLNPTTNLYTVAARGHKSRGFNDYSTQPVDSQPYKAAEVDTYEVGFKHESADRRLSLSGAIYLSEVSDDHLLGYDFNTC